MSLATTFSITNQRSEVAAFADRFEAWCQQQGVSTGVIRAYQVAFDEVLTNIIDYGLDGSGPHSIEIRLGLANGELQAEVVDGGKAFDPLQQSDEPDLDLDLDDRPIGGLGIHLVKTLMDSVSYQRLHDHNHLFLTKRLQD